MPLLPVKLPPGIYRNGTPYSAKGRWYDCDLIRWHDGALRPIGGWERRVDNTAAIMPPLTATPATVTFRDLIVYRSNTGADYALIGSNATLISIAPDGLHTDVTPAGLVAGNNQVTYPIGYGNGFYGRGLYGTPRNITNVQPVPVARWNFSMWGEDVICSLVNNGPIYSYSPGDATPTIISSAPTEVADLLVTQDRILMAIKNGPTEIREVVWCDRENYTDWVSTPTNYAGSFKLQGEGDLIGLYKVQDDILILSETDAHVARFLGAPVVYGFELVGQACAPIAAEAVIKTERFAMWMGRREFWMYDGSLQQVPCDIMDYIVETMDPVQVSKMHTCTISSYRELWWFYQSKDSATGDVDSYVTFDYSDGTWAFGKLDRTFASDRDTYLNPIMGDHLGQIWNHELSSVVVQGTAFAATGPLEIGEGDSNMAVRYLFIDTERPDTIEVAFHTRQLPTEPEHKHGPFQYNNPLSTIGVMGREVRMEIIGLVSDWEAGNMRIDVAEIGGGFR